MLGIHIKLKEFQKFQKLIYDEVGIELKENKMNLMQSRLQKRIRHLNFKNFMEYYTAVNSDKNELQEMINLMTTNETSFFRENKHFDFLKRKLFPSRREPLRIWSAASSIGVEAYTIAMIADEVLSPRHVRFDIFASDINIEVLDKARAGVYDMKFAEQIPKHYLKNYCFKGVKEMEGKFMISDELKAKVSFSQINLTHTVDRSIGEFDIIFLRNVLIYFDIPTKQKVVKNVLARLKKGGYFFIGHSESLFNITDEVVQVMPTVYQKQG